MVQALQRAWLRRGALAWLLLPVSLIFGVLAALRRVAYRAGIFKSTQLPVPVVVVGNVVAGGAGKTPVVIAMLDHLRARGVAAGVVSRGYGRELSDCREVTKESTARKVGDEPLLIARSGAPVFVASRRATAAQALLAAHPKTQVIICDDGLQHYALRRDIEICVFDDRGIGNGWLLPAGPLRETWPRLVDFALVAGGPPGIEGWRIDRGLATHAVRADGRRIELSDLRGQPLTALAGIAKPDAFFEMLRAAGLHVERTVPLADHHPFDIDPAPDAAQLVCTQKDAVKLWRLRPDAWAVALRIEIDPAFWREFDRLLDAKLSSAHGPQTD
ncbi:MAG: tetraacyldisaccharide 4'-kinase [Pseudomonadota bacterium]